MLCWPLIIVEVAELAPCFAGSVKIIIMYQLEKRTGGFGDLYQWKRAVAGRERRRVCYKLKSFKIKTTIINYRKGNASQIFNFYLLIKSYCNFLYEKTKTTQLLLNRKIIRFKWKNYNMLLDRKKK